MKLEQLLHQVVAGYFINYGVHHCIGVSNLYNAHHNHNGAEIETDPTPIHTIIIIKQSMNNR
jgi:hypothetical protein